MIATEMATPRTPRRLTNNRNSVWEQRLTDKGFEFEYVPRVPLVEIERNKENQARIDDAPQEKVDTFATQMSGGAIFPPLLLWDDPKEENGFGLLDGNTRYRAKKQVDPHGTFDAYILKNVQSRDDAIYASAIPNTFNGTPLTKLEREKVALIMRQRDYTNETIAKELGIAPNTLSRLIAVQSFDTRANDLGLDVNGLTTAVKVQAVRLPDDSAFQALIALSIDAALATPDVTALVRATNEARSEADRLKVIADERAERREQITANRAGRAVSTPPAHESLMVLGRLSTLFEKYPNLDAWVPRNADVRATWSEKVGSLRDNLEHLLAAYHAE